MAIREVHSASPLPGPEARAAGAPAGTEAARFLTRLSLGWFMFHQGWGKVVLDWNQGFGAFYRSDAYQGREPSWLPDLIGVPYGYALPALELVLGVLMIAGLFNRVAMAGAAVVFLSIAVALWDNGGFFPRHMLMVFLPLALYFMLTGPGRYSVDAVLLKRRPPHA